MAEQKLGEENPFLQYVTPATGDSGLTIQEENPFLQYVEPAAEDNPFLQYVSAPEPEDRGFFSQMGKGFQGFEFGTVVPKIGLQVDSPIIAKARQYLGAYTQLEEGATPEQLAEGSGGTLDLDQLRRYQQGSEEERQQLREFSETTSERAMARTRERLSTLAESEARTQEFAPAVPGITDVKSLADFRDWLGYSIGAGSKQIIPVMGAAVIGGAPGALAVGTSLAAGETIGNRLSFVQDIVKDLPPEEQATAIAEYLEKTGDTTAMVSLASGALDLAGPVGSILRRRLAKDLGEEVVDRTTGEAFKAAVRRAPKEMLEEGITGGLQEVTQIAGKRVTGEQAGDILSSENIKAVIDAAAAEAAGSIGGSGINITTSTGRQAYQNAKRDAIARILSTQARADNLTQMTEQELMEFGARVDQHRREGKSEEEAVKLAGQETITGDIGAVEEASAQAETDAIEAQEKIAAEPVAEVDETIELPQQEKEGISAMAREDAAEATEFNEVMSQNKAAVLESMGPEAAALYESEARALIDAKRPEEAPSVAGPAIGEITDAELQDDRRAPELGFEEPTKAEPIELDQPELDLGPEVNPVTGLQPKGTKKTRGRPPLEQTEARIAQVAQNTAESKARTQTLSRAVSSASTVIKPEKLTTLLKKYGFETLEEVQAFDPTPQREAAAPVEIEEEAGLSRLERIARAAPKPEQVAEPKQTAEQKKALVERNKRVKNYNALIKQLGKYQKQRIDKLAKLYELRNDPQYRGNGRALANIDKFIAREDISPQERELAKAQAASKKPRRAESFEEATSSQLRPEYANAPQPASLFDAVMQNGTPFEKLLARRLKPFLEGTRLVIVNDVAIDVPADVQQDFYNSKGLYDGPSNTIYLNNTTQDALDSGLNNRVFLHEAVHAATVGVMEAYVRNPELLSPKAQEAVQQIMELMVVAETVYYKRKEAGLTSRALDALADREAGLDVFSDLYEFVSYGLTQPEFQEFLTVVTPVERSGLSRFLDAVRSLFNIPRNQDNAFLSLMDLTDTVIEENKTFKNLNPSVVAQAKKQAKRGSAQANKLAKSARPEAMVSSLGELVAAVRSGADASRLLKSIYQAIDAKALRAVLGTFTSDGIVRSFGDAILNLKVTNDVVQDMAIYRGRMLRALSEKVPKWAEFNAKFQQGAIILADVMHLATLHNFDPAKHKDLATALKNDAQLVALRRKQQQVAANPLMSKGQKVSARAAVTRRENQIREVYEGATVDGDVYAGWNNLQKEENGGQRGVEIYKMARDSYKDTLQEHQFILQQKVARSNLPDEAKKVVLAEITKNFQEAKRLEVYFPLMRYGDWWLRVGKGQQREFYMFESEVARNDFARKRAEERGQNYEDALESEDIQIGQNSQTNEFRKEINDSSATLKKVFELLDESPSANTPDIKDSVYQMYLMTLSGQDMRRRFVHRKGVAGFSTDVLRNFVTSQHTSANQLARLQFSEDIRNGIAQAYAELKGRPDAARLKIVVDEVAGRALDEASPPKLAEGVNWDSMASFGNKVVFYWLLSAPKSAIIQLTQLPIVGLPVLAAEFGGVNAHKIAARYMATLPFNKLGTSKFDDEGVLQTRFSEPSMNKSSYVLENPDRELSRALQEAWSYANDRDLFMSTYAADLTARGQIPSRSHGALPTRIFRGTANMMSGLFHHTERINREIMYMSSFELAYADAKKRGLTGKAAQQEAQQRAMDLTYRGLFNYSNYNKPRLMKSTAVGRIATQFLTFPMQMTSYMVRNFFNMLSMHKSFAEKKQAATQFFGTMGMTFMFAGATGLPLYTSMMALMEGIREAMRPEGEDDDPWYDEDDYGNPLGKRNLDLWFRESFLPQYFGKDSSIAKSLGLSDETADLLQRGVELGPISALTGLNIGASTSLDGLWFRDDIPRESTEEELVNWFYNTGTGPFGSLIRSGSRAYDDIRDGKYQRAMEGLLPAFFRNPVKALRFYEEGNLTRQGAEVKPEEYYTAFKLVGQTLGFSDTEVAEIQNSNFLVMGLVNELKQEKGALLDDLDDAVTNYENSLSDKSYDAILKVMDEITQHNLRNPWTYIDIDTMERSLKGRAERRGASFEGLYVDKKLQPVILTLKEKIRNP